MKTIIRLLKMFSFQLLVLWFAHNHACAQQVALVGEPDSSFPVTNRFLPSASPYSLVSSVGIYSITKNESKYYLFGNFTSMAKNSGSSVVIDSASATITNRLRWQVNGVVYTTIPDGNGGFYIGGDFTKIGDSIRTYLAQIDRFGKPTSWNPKADSVVMQISKRNDTLFIGGFFSHFSNVLRPRFAMYSITGDSLLASATTGRFSLIRSINSFLLDHDTLIYAAGTGSLQVPLVGKYNLRSSTYFMFWQLTLPPSFYTNRFDELCFNQDSTVILCAAEDVGTGGTEVIRGFNKVTGSLVYKITPYRSVIGDLVDGSLKLKVLGDKLYLAGPFEKILPNTGSAVNRHGFAVFNASTGAITNEVLSIHGYTYFVDGRDGKLFLSGIFDSVNTQPRLNFAAIDTGTLSLDPFQLSPTDPLITLSFSQGTIFASGLFHGVYAVPRKGMALIDSATSEILPWAPTAFACEGLKKMQVSGDTLFVLGKNVYCPVSLGNPAFHMYRISTAEEMTDLGSMPDNINDFLIDGNYIYASYNAQMTRYNIQGLTTSAWSIGFHNILGSNNFFVTGMILKNDTIYCIGDERFSNCDFNLVNKAWVVKIPKATGTPFVYYSYLPIYPEDDRPTFDYAALSGDNKLFIQGKFSDFDGLDRELFMCVNTDNGSITNWQPPFSTNNYDYELSAIKFFNGRVWVGGYTALHMNDTSFFDGFCSIDTANGTLDNPSLIAIPGGHTFLKIYPNIMTDYFTPNVRHFILEDNELVIAGMFDSLNNVTAGNLVRYKIQYSGRTYTFNGNGNWTNPANWTNNEIPPAILPGSDAIIINPAAGGQCVLNILQTINAGAVFTVTTGSSFIVAGNLNIVD